MSPRIVLAALLLTFLVPAAPAQAAAISGGVGFRDHNYSSSVTAPTGQKPESKLWHADGSWWGVLWTATSPRRYEIHKFNLATQSTNAWTKTGVLVDTRRNSEADTLFDSANNKLYVLSHLKDTDTSTSTSPAVTFSRYSYSPTTRAYTLDQSATVASKKTETAVLDKDSTGKIWVTFTEANKVYVTHSTSDDFHYATPYVLPVAGANNLATDDISTLVAYGDAGGRKIGVLWSNAVDDALYFASHVDGTGDTAANWTRTTLCATTLCPDDHLNIKSIDADTSGHIYAAVKTSLNDASPKVDSDPLIVIYKLNTSGGWSSSVAWRVAQDVTRAIVLIDSQNRRVHTFAAGPCCSGGTVYTKNASLDNLTFPEGFGTTFMKVDDKPSTDTTAQPINNPTSTKQSVNGNTGLLVLAGVDRTRDYVHNYLTLPGGTAPDTTAPTVTAVSPTSGATGVATNTTATATFSEAVTGVSGTTFTLTRTGTTVPATVTMNAGNTTATLTPTAALAASTTYTATVKGGSTGVKDTAGNALAADRVWTFTTAAGTPPPGGGDTVTLSATADTYGASATPTTNLGTAKVLGVDASSAEVGYLKYDLGPHAGKTVTGATLQIRATTSGSVGTQNVKLVTDDSWTETGLTYNARPALGASLGTVGPTSGNTNYTVSLNAGSVQGQLGGPLSLGLDSTSSDGVDLGSRESTTPPTLVLTFSGGGTPPPGDTTAPTVTAVTPAENATGVAASTTVTATFSEDVTGVSGTTFTLTTGGTGVPAAVTYNAASRTATLAPSAALAASTTYTASINGGATEVRDAADNQLADKSWTFTTAAATPPPTGGETVTLTATADTYGAASASTTNYGTNALLGVDASSAAVSYLKFDLGAYAGRTVTGATLQIRATTSGSVGTQNVKLVTDDSWTESGLTYNARPALGAALGTLGPTSRDTNYTVTLNAGSVQGQLGGAFSLGLDSTSSDGVDLGSRETAIPPRLVLTFS